MKKYIVKLFELDDPDQLQLQMRLAYFIGRYNETGGDIPNQDLVNYIHNKIPKAFVIYNFGGYGKGYHVQFHNKAFRCGLIELIQKDVLKPGMTVRHKYISNRLTVVEDEKGPAHTGNEFKDNEISFSHAEIELRNGNLEIIY